MISERGGHDISGQNLLSLESSDSDHHLDANGQHYTALLRMCSMLLKSL